MSDLPPDLARAHDAFTAMYDALRSLTYHRALGEAGMGDSPFWDHTRSQLLRTFVLEWMKLFGTDSNELHWKKLVTEEPEFREAILEKAGLSPLEWQSYRQQIKDLRDKVVAHLDPFDRPGEVPDLEPARAALLAGYQWIRQQIIDAGTPHKGPEDLEAWANELHQEELVLAKTAIDATKDCPEKRPQT